MNVLIYWGMALAGAVTLLIEAHRNYNQSLSSVPFKEHPILQNVEIGNLTTAREKNIGFAFYSLLYIVVYIIILSSTEVYELLRHAQRVTHEVGPAGFSLGSNEGLLGHTDYAKPIIVSAGIIAMFSAGLFMSVEKTMRSLAHRLAGIPRGVYKIIDDLHSFSFEEHSDLKGPKTLTKMFEENARSAFQGSFDSEQIETIISALLTIDYLSPALTGKQRIQHFPFTQLDAMRDLSLRLNEQVQTLLKILSHPDPDEERRAAIYSTAMSTANDSIALFAIHLLRNNRAIKNVGPGTAIEAIYSKIKTDYHIELNSFAMALFFSLFLALSAGYWLTLHWAYYALGGNLPDSNWVTVRYDQWKGVLRFVFSDIIPVWGAIAAAALSAILGRDVRREDNSWPTWPLRRFPFVRLFFLSIVPALLAAFCVGLIAFVIYWAGSGFELTQFDIAFFFKSKASYFLMHAPLGMFIAIAALVLMDQHDQLSFAATLFLAIIFGLAALAIYYLVVIVGYSPAAIRKTPEGWPWPVNFEIRETLRFGSCAFFFLIFFGLFLEITEDPGDRNSLER